VRLAATERPSPGSRPPRLSGVREREHRPRVSSSNCRTGRRWKAELQADAPVNAPEPPVAAPLMRSRARWAGIAPVSPFFNSALQITESGREPHRYADGTPLRRNSLPASRERPMSAAFQRRPGRFRRCVACWRGSIKLLSRGERQSEGLHPDRSDLRLQAGHDVTVPAS
jgi:hypothetical protein